MFKIIGNYKRNSDESDSLSGFEYDLNEAESSRVLLARQSLSEISDMEHLYDHIVESMNDFKTCLYSCNLQSSSNQFSRDIERVNDVEVRGKLNRRALSLLNMSKLYLDKSFWFSPPTDSFVKRVTLCEEMHEKVGKLAKEIRKNNINFILGSQLRNYSQHTTLPIDTLTRGVSRDGSGKLTHSFSLPIRLSEIKEFVEGQNSPSRYILDIFQRIGDKEDLHSILDGYVLSIGQIHQLNRSLTDSYISSNKKVLDDLHTKLKNLYPNMKFVYLLEFDERNRAKHKYQFGYNWFEAVEYLKEKNHAITDWNSVRFTEYDFQKFK